MIIKGLIDEDFVNYKTASMVIEFPYCDFKCDKENCNQLCQNSHLIKEPDISISYENIVERYLKNPITKAIIFQGLEPIDSSSDVINLISAFRKQYHCDDDIVIYTGYKEREIQSFIEQLKQYKNIIVKFGRFRPYLNSCYDPVLKVNLASNNQYAKKIS